MDRFVQCLEFVLGREGEYSNLKDDRGGATNCGITQRTYDEWQERHGLPTQSVRLISKDEVSCIYKGAYWNKCECANLPQPIDLVVFDSAVQHGTERACKWVQHLVCVAVDGVIGFKTLYAVNDYVMRNRLKTLVDDYMDARYAFYAGIISRDPTQKKFERGWNNRMVRLEFAVNQQLKG